MSKLVRLHGWFNRGKIAEQLNAFAAGLVKHGWRVEHDHDDIWRPADLHVCWSRRWKNVRADDTPCVYVENAYLGQRVREWMSVGYDDINGWARRPEPGTEPREAQWKPYMREWETKGHNILLTGQVHTDLTVREYIPNYNAWVEEISAELELFWDKEIKFRRHPKYGRRHEFVPLEQDLRDAEFVVTFNSNSAVDAVFNGVPTITLGPGSMAAEVTGHKLTQYPPTPDRGEWLKKLAWAQWTQEECRSGKCWEWLSGGYVQ